LSKLYGEPLRPDLAHRLNNLRMHVVAWRVANELGAQGTRRRNTVSSRWLSKEVDVPSRTGWFPSRDLAIQLSASLPVAAEQSVGELHARHTRRIAQ
jgi:hypothetical protein